MEGLGYLLGWALGWHGASLERRKVTEVRGSKRAASGRNALVPMLVLMLVVLLFAGFFPHVQDLQPEAPHMHELTCDL